MTKKYSAVDGFRAERRSRAAQKRDVAAMTVRAAGLEVDESLLTGEADPVVKQPGDTVMSGSFVVAGSVNGST